MADNNRPLFGSKAFRLDVKQAQQEGFRIFRAWHSCGCCRFDMAFYTKTGIRREFDLPQFADVVRDDMGNIYEAVNTGRGFVEVRFRRRPHPIVDTSVQVPL